MTDQFTPEWWKERLPLIQAFADGKTVQINTGPKNNPDWQNVFVPTFNADLDDYRIAPETNLRPWRPEEVPVGALTTSKSVCFRTLIIACNGVGVFLGTGEVLTFEEMLDRRKYSIDGGKTWLPCGVQEVASE